jgi:Fe2+ transport system protein FeoA
LSFSPAARPSARSGPPPAAAAAPPARTALPDPRLADQPAAAEVVIDGIVGDAIDATLLRLWEMGLVPGTPVRVTRRAPWGDPLEVEVRGTRLVLRAAEARRFAVRPASVDGARVSR